MIRIDLRSATSLEDQLISQIRELIATGALVTGQAMPSTRQLAADLAIHFNTVARAYRRLKDQGLLRVEQGRGVSVGVSAILPNDSARRLREELVARLRQIFVDARLVGVSAKQMRDVVASELNQFFPQEEPR